MLILKKYLIDIITIIVYIMFHVVIMLIPGPALRTPRIIVIIIYIITYRKSTGTVMIEFTKCDLSLNLFFVLRENIISVYEVRVFPADVQ